MRFKLARWRQPSRLLEAEITFGWSLMDWVQRHLGHWLERAAREFTNE